MKALFCIAAALFGLIIGCFTNTIEYRMRSELKLFTNDCYCPHCRKKLRLSDQIPLFGYLRLCGKCRFCRERISLLYPIIELGTAVVYAAIAFVFYPSALLTSVFSLGAVIILIACLHLARNALGISKKRLVGILFLAALQTMVCFGLFIIAL